MKKQINIKNHTYYCLDGLININDWDFENIRLDKKSFEDTFTSYLGYEIPYSIKPWHMIFHNRNGYTKDLDGKKYVVNKKIKVCWRKREKLLIKFTNLLKGKKIMKKTEKSKN